MIRLSPGSGLTETVVVLGAVSRQRAEWQIDTLDTGTVHIKTSDCVKESWCSH